MKISRIEPFILHVHVHVPVTGSQIADTTPTPEAWERYRQDAA